MVIVSNHKISCGSKKKISLRGDHYTLTKLKFYIGNFIGQKFRPQTAISQKQKKLPDSCLCEISRVFFLQNKNLNILIWALQTYWHLRKFLSTRKVEMFRFTHCIVASLTVQSLKLLFALTWPKAWVMFQVPISTLFVMIF